MIRIGIRPLKIIFFLALRPSASAGPYVAARAGAGGFDRVLELWAWQKDNSEAAADAQATNCGRHEGQDG